MLFLILLGVATASTAAVLAARRRFTPQGAARIGLAAALVLAGVAHILMPTPFVQHLPPWVPAREALVALTGVIEAFLGGALLLQPPRRRFAGLMVAAYLVAVFPANVYVAVSGTDVNGQPGGPYPWLRLPFQLLFVVWALWSTGALQLRSRPSSTPSGTAVAAEHS